MEPLSRSFDKSMIAVQNNPTIPSALQASGVISTIPLPQSFADIFLQLQTTDAKSLNATDQSPVPDESAPAKTQDPNEQDQASAATLLVPIAAPLPLPEAIVAAAAGVPARSGGEGKTISADAIDSCRNVEAQPTADGVDGATVGMNAETPSVDPVEKQEIQLKAANSPGDPPGKSGEQAAATEPTSCSVETRMAIPTLVPPPTDETASAIAAPASEKSQPQASEMKNGCDPPPVNASFTVTPLTSAVVSPATSEAPTSSAKVEVTRIGGLASASPVKGKVAASSAKLLRDQAEPSEAPRETARRARTFVPQPERISDSHPESGTQPEFKLPVEKAAVAESAANGSAKSADVPSATAAPVLPAMTNTGKDATPERTPAATAPPSPPVLPEKPPAVARMVERLGQSEMHIGFRTSAFGSVEVHTTVRESQVGVSVGSEHGDLRSLLSGELPGLQANLRQHDLHVASIAWLGSSAAAGGFSGGSHSQEFARSQPAEPNLAVEDAAEPETVEAAPAGRSELDVRV
jgi:hypothetical protein